MIDASMTTWNCPTMTGFRFEMTNLTIHIVQYAGVQLSGKGRSRDPTELQASLHQQIKENITTQCGAREDYTTRYLVTTSYE